MTAENYASLTFDERASILWERGMFIDTVDYYRQKVHLYSLHSFFVEVYYNDSENKIERIEIAGPDQMRKFLSRIDL